MSIRLDNISKHFGKFQALSPLSLHIEDGEMIGLLGPSGSGKTAGYGTFTTSFSS